MDIAPQKTACAHLTKANYRENLQGALVYKDQCGKCFHDPRDEKGLDICLKCLGGFCAHRHSSHHFNQASHPIVLNFRLIEKVKTEEEKNSEVELTKLAIGKPGGASLNQQEFDEVFQLRCQACNIDLDNSLLADIVKKVSAEDSAFKKNDICEWELQIHPCEHTLTLEQIPKDMSQGLGHCHQCELSSNLWLCLVCGNVGCGRKNYDGSGGNNHAVDHSKTHGHPLVVKLGTITHEGNASIYCYTCDNDVSDNSLAGHLGVFGINVAEQEKTEKTVMEMNLDLNKALTLSSILEEGKMLKPLFGTRRTGMQNIGNSCYINSVFQTLFALPEFEERFLHKGAQHLASCTKSAVSCLTCQLSKLSNGLVNGEYSQKKEVKILSQDPDIELPEEQKYQQDGVAINDLRILIGKDHPEFKTKQMQDALEYLQHFFDFLEKEEKATKENNSLIRLFEHKTVNKLSCMNCGGVKLVETKTNELKLPVPRPTKEQLAEAERKQAESNKAKNNQAAQDKDNGKVDAKLLEEPEYDTDFEQSMEAIKQGELNELNCVKCGPKQQFRSTVLFKTAPKYLLVPTNRLILENWVPKKLNATIAMPAEYDFKDICFKGLAENENLLEPATSSDEAPANAFVFDEMAMLQLLEMGFGDNRAKRALMKFNNNPEAAMNFLFENFEDASLDLPIEPVAQKKKEPQGFQVDAENLSLLESMGFNTVQCSRALKKFKNNVELALDGLSSGDYYEEEVEQPASEKMEEEDKPIESSKYELIAAIVHLGKSTHAGHYITYVKREGEWIYYNDAKVAASIDPSLGKGYIYLFKQK